MIALETNLNEKAIQMTGSLFFVSLGNEALTSIPSVANLGSKELKAIHLNRGELDRVRSSLSPERSRN